MINLTYFDPDLSLSQTGQLSIDYNVSPETLNSLGYSAYKNEIETAQYQLNDTLGQPVTRLGQFAKIAVAKIESGLIKTTNLIADNIAVGNAYIRSAKIDEINTAIISPIGEISDTIVVDGKLNITDSLTAKDIGTTSLTTDNLTAQDATISTLYAENIISREGNFGDLMTDKISSLRSEIRTLIENSLNSPIDEDNLLATDIGQQSQTWNLEVGTSQAQITGSLGISDNLVVSGQLAILGQTSLTDLFVSGTFSSGLIGIRDNIIETADNHLYIQPSQTGIIHLLGDTLVIADTGNIMVNGNLNISGNVTADTANFNTLSTASIFTSTIEATDASISGTLIADTVKADTFQVATSSATPIIAEAGFGSIATTSAQLQTNATAGTANLPSSKTEIIIYNPKLTANSMVYLTPQGSTNNQVVYVKNKFVDELDSSLSYFTIALDQPLVNNLDINWWIIN